jgi:hypothetical protein
LGSEKVWLVPGQAGRDLSPGANILSELRRRTSADEALPHLTLVAEEDEMILPGAFPEYGEHRLIPRTGHNGILFSEDAIEQVTRRIGHLDGETQPSPQSAGEQP